MATDKPADDKPSAPIENKETKTAALGEDDEFEDFPVDGTFPANNYTHTHTHYHIRTTHQIITRKAKKES
jgi:hypothetical protein